VKKGDEMLPPPRHQPKVDPEELIRQIENDPVSQFVWDIVPEMSKAIRKISESIRPSLAKPTVEKRADKRLSSTETSSASKVC
jgi:hypothetical protein